MFARLSIYDNVDLSLADRVASWVASIADDPFRDLPGYRGSMTLIDRDNARLIGIGFYASSGAAQEADTHIAALYAEARDSVPEDIRPSLDMRPQSVAIYEIAHRD